MARVIRKKNPRREKGKFAGILTDFKNLHRIYPANFCKARQLQLCGIALKVGFYIFKGN